MRTAASRLPLLVAAAGVMLLSACSGSDDAPPSGSTSGTTSAPTTSAVPSPSPSATGEQQGPAVPTGPTAPASAAEVAACRDAIKKQFDMAGQQKDPGGMPQECTLLTEAQLTTLLGEFIGGQG